MFRIQPAQTPSLLEALITVISIIIIISTSIIHFETTPHMALMFSIILLIIYGTVKRVPHQKLQEGLSEGAKSGMGAVFIFFLMETNVVKERCINVT